MAIRTLRLTQVRVVAGVAVLTGQVSTLDIWIVVADVSEIGSVDLFPQAELGLV